MWDNSIVDCPDINVMLLWRTFFLALSLGLLASCAQITPSRSCSKYQYCKAFQNARTCSDHEALTKYFEGARQGDAYKGRGAKKILEHSEQKSNLYDRQAQDLKSHAWALARKYEETAEANIKESASSPPNGIRRGATRLRRAWRPILAHLWKWRNTLWESLARLLHPRIPHN